MNAFVTESNRSVIPDRTIWRIMHDSSGNVVPMYELHIGLNQHEWFNVYLYNTGFNTFWVIAHIPILHNIAETVYETYGMMKIYHEYLKVWPILIKGLNNRRDFELLPAEDQTFCIEKFPDFDSVSSADHWKLATICDIGKPLTMDFIENLSDSEKKIIIEKAFSIYPQCCHIEDELEKSLSKESQNIIKNEWNQFADENHRKARFIRRILKFGYIGYIMIGFEDIRDMIDDLGDNLSDLFGVNNVAEGSDDALPSVDDLASSIHYSSIDTFDESTHFDDSFIDDSFDSYQEDKTSEIAFKSSQRRLSENEDGFIPRGKIELERVVSGSKDKFDYYTKDGNDYVKIGNVYIRIDQGNQVTIRNVKYETK